MTGCRLLVSSYVVLWQIEELKRKKREREELGVELLGVQQELAKQQMSLEGIQDTYGHRFNTPIDIQYN